jgi:hypothetical protein
MGPGKKCYKCLTEASEEAKACPRCGAKLGARTESGIAAKPGSHLPLIIFIVVVLALIGKIAVHSNPDNSAPALVKISNGLDNAKDTAIKTIKDKGSSELATVGVTDLGYKDDTLCVYVDQRFIKLSQAQQEELLGIVAGEWKKAINKTTTAVKVLEAGTDKAVTELVV